MTKGFLRIVPIEPDSRKWESNQPVLWRAVLFPMFGGEFVMPDERLRSYPAKVLYGGPSVAGSLRGPAYETWNRAMGFWAANHQLGLVSEVIAIAPSSYPTGSNAPVWPHTSWRWWYENESRAKTRYRLAQRTPTHWEWRRA